MIEKVNITLIGSVDINQEGKNTNLTKMGGTLS